MLREEFDFIVETVPLDIKRIIFAVGPVLTVCPSKIRPPALTWFGGIGSCVSLFITVTSPSRDAIIMAPFELVC